MSELMLVNLTNDVQSASPKGLFIIPANNEPQGIPILIPSLHGLKWIMVIEKEATFNTLCENNFHQHSRTGPGMLLTVSSPEVIGHHEY